MHAPKSSGALVELSRQYGISILFDESTVREPDGRDRIRKTERRLETRLEALLKLRFEVQAHGKETLCGVAGR